MSDVDVQITKKHANDLARIVAMGVDKAHEFKNAVGAAKPGIVRLSALRKIANDIYGDEVAAIFVRHLVGLAGLKDRKGVSSHDTVRAIGDALAAHDLEKVYSSDDWEKVAPIFVELLNSEAVRIALKSMNLSYEYSELYIDGKVLTDVRPVFNGDRNEVAGSIIVFKLLMDVSRKGVDEKFDITMDLKDIENLKESCTIALEKAEKLKGLMITSCNVDCFILGEEDIGL